MNEHKVGKVGSFSAKSLHMHNYNILTMITTKKIMIQCFLYNFVTVLVFLKSYRYASRTEDIMQIGGSIKLEEERNRSHSSYESLFLIEH